MDAFQAKELRNFMAKRKIPMDGCKEKHDFIEVLMQYTNNIHYRREKELEENRRLLMEVSNQFMFQKRHHVVKLHSRVCTDASAEDRKSVV